ncbi:MAG: hypothetical protein LBD71_08190 [Treponema sp.]|jgi:hypothetical protein|nr:hypothetical protein [Treponema sp.]
MIKLTEAERRTAMESGDFDAGLVSGPPAAIVLTRSRHLLPGKQLYFPGRLQGSLKRIIRRS